MLLKILEKAKKENKPVYIYAHRFPDGDATASSIALQNFLSQNGVKAKYVVIGKPNFSFKSIVGQLESFKGNVPSNSISIILDTSTLQNAENTLFKKSSPEDTFVIDHHAKAKDTPCIEDELHIPKENVIRNPESSSTCEILTEELDKYARLTKDLSTTLLLGMMTDTARFRHLKSNTLDNLKLLLNKGADYEKVSRFSARKQFLRQEVGLAKAFLATKRIPTDNLNINYLELSNEDISYLQRTYRLNAIQKKIFKMSNISDSAINMVVAENSPGEYDFEFRSNPSYGNANVENVAISNNGGGHYNASGCHIVSSDSLSKVSQDMLSQLTPIAEEAAHSYSPAELNDSDKKLEELLDYTDRFTRNVTPENIDKFKSLLSSSSTYPLLYDSPISFEQFMVRNELLALIPDNVLDNKSIHIKLDTRTLDRLVSTYNMNPEEILDQIVLFKNININSVSISLPDKRTISIDSHGNVKKSNGEKSH